MSRVVDLRPGTRRNKLPFRESTRMSRSVISREFPAFPLKRACPGWLQCAHGWRVARATEARHMHFQLTPTVDGYVHYPLDF